MFFLISFRRLAFSVAKASLMIFSLRDLFFDFDLGRPSKSLSGRTMVSIS
jgi:hypothetical protein